jgi:SAM-dependent methyltransferase
MTKGLSTWYESWFNTNYYHRLYKNRDYQEAKKFISNLSSYLNIDDNAKILDLACGKGRHALFLNQLGFNVTGVDLSPESIDYASQFENDTLKFLVHDMRVPLESKFDFICNLFTSFGYFESNSDNEQVITSIKSALNTHGIGVIDYFNTTVVLDHLVDSETIIDKELVFNIKRHHKDSQIIKDIVVEDGNQKYSFQERVKSFQLIDFQTMLSNNGLELLECFGNYNLDQFDERKSERLILIFIKK